MDIYLDIETIPAQQESVIERCREAANNDFKAPSSLTKQQAADDLGITDKKEIQSYSKDSILEHWTAVFKEAKTEVLFDELYRKTALSGAIGEVISIVALCGDSSYSLYRELGDKLTESGLIDGFFSWVMGRCEYKQHHTQPFFIGHNIPFDLQFLYQRAVILGINPGFDLPFNGLHGKNYYCTSQAWCRRSNQERISQNELARVLGLEQKPDDIDGAKVWDFVKVGNAKRVNEYNNYDVDTVKAIYERLTFKNKDGQHAKR